MRHFAFLLTTPFKVSLEFVGRDLELVSVGIAEINRVRDFVVLEFEFDSALFEHALRGKKIFPARTEGEVKHSDVIARYRARRPLRDRFLQVP